MQALQTVFDFLKAAASPASLPSARLPSSSLPSSSLPSSSLSPARLQQPVPGPAPAPRLAEPSSAASPIAQLERDLSLLLGNPVRVSLTDNTRTMVSAKHRSGESHVRLHRMFERADAQTLESVARFLTRRDRHAVAALRRYIASHQDHVRRRRPRRLLLSAIGEHHDLGAIFDELNALYFEGSVKAHVGWGRMGRSPGMRAGTRAGRHSRRRSIKLGSYLSTGALIRVHPVLDAGWVPRFFVEYIVYHEMLHHVVDMPVRNGRRCMHGAEFKARERNYARYEAAMAWEREHLDRLLASG